MEEVNLKDFVLSKLEEKKAEEIKIFDTKDLHIASYIIVANGRSIKNVSAMADYISCEIKKKLRLNVALEGVNHSNWVVLDMQSVILHIFHPETRSYYNIDDIFTKAA